MSKKKKILILVLSILVIGIIVAGVIIWSNNTDAIKHTGNKANVSWYDEAGKEFTITTVDELYGLQKLSDYYDFAGQTIKLGADITVNEGDAKEWASNPPTKKWYAITGFAGTFDGQGHTISGIYAKGIDMTVALFADTANTCVIRDFRLVNSYFASGGNLGTASISSNGSGTFEKIYTDALVDCGGANCGGIIGRAEMNTTISECWFDGEINATHRAIGGMVGIIEFGTVEIEHSLNSGVVYTEWKTSGARVGGICGVVNKADCNLVVKDTLSAGKVGAANKTLVGSVVGVAYGNTTCTFESTFASLNTYSQSIGTGGEQGTFNGSTMEMVEEDLIGYRGYQWTNLDFENYWAVAKEGTPVLKYFATEVPSLDGVAKVYDLSWYDEKKSEYILDSAEDLYGLYILSSGNKLMGKTFTLGADIVVNEGNASDWEKKAPDKRWYPIKIFAGTFDGQGHTISGIYLNSEGYKVGLFSETDPVSTIKNVRIVNSYFNNNRTDNVLMGSIAGSGNGTFDTVYSEAIVSSSGIAVGGLIGNIKGIGSHTITNCWFNGTLKMREETGRYGGGIVGTVTGGVTTIQHCLSTATISCEATKKGSHIGGMVASLMNDKTVLNITDSMSGANITVANQWQVGSVIGRVPEGTTVNISDVFATKEGYEKAVGYVDNGTQNGAPFIFPEKTLSGNGGYEWTSLDFKEYWTTVANSTPMLRSFTSKVQSVSGLKKMFDISWYHADKHTYTLKDAEDLYGLYMISSGTDFSKKTVKLGADIVVNNGNAEDWATNAPNKSWFPINKFAGTFDGQGHTISGIYVKDSVKRIGLFSETTVDGAIKNLRLTNSYFENTNTEEAISGTVVGRSNGLLDSVYSNAIITSTGIAVGGLTGQTNGEGIHRITNCWFDGNVRMKGETGRYAGGIIGTLAGGTTVIEHSLFTGTISCEATKAGSHVAGFAAMLVNKDTKLQLKDCLSAGVVSAINQMQVASVIGRIPNHTSVEIEDVFATKECHSKAIGYNVEGGTLKGTAFTFSETVLSGAGGYEFTNLNFDKYWSLVSDDVPTLKHFGGNMAVTGLTKAFDLSWYDEKADTFVLKDSQDLYGFYMISSNTDFAGKTVKLGADIVVNDISINPKDDLAAAYWEEYVPQRVWFPINKFAGTFDGQGHTIRGIYVKDSVKRQGLFSETSETAVIKNLKLKDSYINATLSEESISGSVVGRSNGTLDTVYSSAIVQSNNIAVGGITGQANSSGSHKITNCWFDGRVVMKEETGRYAGGIIGTVAGGTTTIEHCLFTGVMTCEATKAGSHIAGIAAYAVNKNTTLNIKDTLSAGTITVDNQWQSAAVMGHVPKNTSLNLQDVYAIENSVYYTTGQKYLNTPVHTVSGTKKGDAVVCSNTLLAGYGGYQYSSLNFDKYWDAVAGKTPVLTSFATEKALSLSKVVRMDISWYNKTDKEFTLTTPAQLYGFAYLVNEGAESGTQFSGKTIYLGADIDLNPQWDAENAETSAPKNVWIPIGTKATFKGIFDGKNHTIRGLYATSSGQMLGFFAQANATSVIRNLRIENSYFESTFSGGDGDRAFAGSVAGYTKGNVCNVSSDAIIVGQGYGIGGLLGSVTADNGTQTKSVSNCQFTGKIILRTVNGRRGGGLIGTIGAGNINGGVVFVEHCLFAGEIAMPATGKGPQSGGIIGRLDKGTCNVTDTLSAGKIIGTDYVTQTGSIAGYVLAGTTMNLQDVYAKKNIISCTESLLPSYNADATVGQVESGAQVVGSATVLEKLTGKNGYINTTLDFEDYWIAVEGKTPQLKTFSKEDAMDLSGIHQVDTRWYSDSANSYVIRTSAELYGLAYLVNTSGKQFKNKTISLGADITVNPDTWDAKADKVIKPEYSWEPIGLNRTFQGTFSGLDTTTGEIHAIRGLYVKSSGQMLGLFGQVNESGHICNLKLQNSYFESTYSGGDGDRAFAGSIAGYTKGNVTSVYSDAVVVGSHYGVGGLIGSATANNATQIKTISDCWFAGTVKLTGANGRRGGGLIGTIGAGGLNGGVTNVEHCLFTGQLSIPATGKGPQSGGIIGRVEKGTCNIKDSLSAGKIVGTDYVTQTGSVAGYIVSGATLTLQDVYAMKGSISCTNPPSGYTPKPDEAIGANGKENGATVSGTVNVKDKEALRGQNGYQGTTLDFANYWMAVEGKTPELSTFSKEKPAIIADTSWYSDENTSFTISNANQLYGLATLVNVNGKQFKGKTIYLGADITVNPDTWNAKADTVTKPEYVWTPIGFNKSFQGTFDGQNHTISGLYQVAATNYMGLFGEVSATSEGGIKNLRLVNSYFEMTSSKTILIGSIAAYSGANITNVYSDAHVKSAGYYTGGIVGGIKGSATHKISNCWFSGIVNSTGDMGRFAGGIAGCLYQGNSTLENCLFTGKLLCDNTANSPQVGGIIGTAGNINNTQTVLKIKNCLSAGNITATGSKYNVASVLGNIRNSSSATIENVYATKECYAGGAGKAVYGSESLSKQIVECSQNKLQGTDCSEILIGFDFEDTWTNRKNGVPALKVFVKVEDRL